MQKKPFDETNHSGTAHIFIGFLKWMKFVEVYHFIHVAETKRVLHAKLYI